MNNPLITIIVPLFNSENSIKRCVNSVLRQTYENFELILIDDGSKDNSYAVCELLQKKDSRIRLISKSNGGVSSARNIGINQARGEYVCFIDADDYVSRVYLSTLLKHVEEKIIPICGINCITKFRTFKERIKKSQTIPSPSFKSIQIVKDVELLNAPVNKLYRKELIGFQFCEDLKMGEDLIFNLNYLNRVKYFHITRKCLYFYDRTNPSATRSFRENAIEEQSRLWMLASDICRTNYQDFDIDYFKKIYLKEIDAILIGAPCDSDGAVNKTLIEKWLAGNEFKKSLSFFEIEDMKYLDSELTIKWITDEKNHNAKTLKKRIKKILQRLFHRRKKSEVV